MTSRRLAWAGVRWFFFLASLFYLWRYASGLFAEHRGAAWMTPAILARTGISALVFASTGILSVLGWRSLLKHLGHPLPLLMVGRVFCLTQIAKYVPGNIGHHVGRVALAKTTLNVPITTSVASLMQESALVTLAVLLVGAACYGLAPGLSLPSQLSGMGHGAVFMAMLAVVAAGLAALALANLLKSYHASVSHRALRFALRAAPSWSATAATLPGYLMMYVVNGVAVTVIASALLPLQPADLLLLTTAYSLSWLVGFLLPGAPGGLGVREAAMLFLLRDVYPGDIVLTLTLLSRVATVVADFLIFLGGAALRRTAGGH